MATRHGFDPETVRAAAHRRLAELEARGDAQRTGMTESSDILWGWGEIAAYARVSVDKARKLAQNQKHPLPVWRNQGRMVMSTKTAIRRWANEVLEKTQMAG